MMNWGKLKTYKDANWKSFEELCYQVAKRLFGSLGKFTPIDDSGGGDGVEFYLTLPNGDEWGWQAKFYYPNIRLNVSNRKNSIKNSLNRTIKVHPRLKYWFLCTPSDFTSGEIKWFNQTLKKLAPNIELVHWGDSEFNDFLNRPKFVGIKPNFFGDLELDTNWFSSRVRKQISNLKDRFIGELHTETNVDFRVHCLLADSKFKEFIRENLDKAKYEAENFSEKKEEPERISLNSIPVNLQRQILKILPNLKDTQDKVIQSIQDFLNFIEEGSIRQALDFKLENADKLSADVDDLRNASTSIYKLAQESSKEKKESIFYRLHKLNELLEYLNEFGTFIYKIERAIHNFKKPVLHIFGDAAIGKTHIACHICEERVKNKLPAILLLGRDFTKDKTIERKILEILDIEAQYSWSDFMLALESVANAYRSRIPIVIDALNESETVGIWKNQLSGFIEALKKHPNIVLINTCRTRYIDAIWEAEKPRNYVYTYGFDETNLEEAVNKYFDYYKMKADLTLAPLNQFKHPIYLRLFCEVKNPERKGEKQIYLGKQTLFEIFDEYLQKCNKKISYKLSKPHNLNIIQDILKRFAEAVWANKSRYINYPDAIQLIDKKTPFEIDWDTSFTRALLDEGLLISRKWIDGTEKVSFTYDLLGGYLIGRHLLHERSVKTVGDLVKSKEFEENLLNDDYTKLHPLFEDILRSICALFPKKFSKHLYELTKNKRAFSFSIHALFEIDPKLIDESSVKLLTKLFDIPENRKPLLRSLRNTTLHVGHPLNANFLDNLLRNLPMAERDLAWTELIRDDSSDLEIEIEKFENISKTNGEFSDISRRRLHLAAQHLSWLLTSTDRAFRDRTTQALYWFGRKFPEKLFELTEKSLNINDPYVPERMLAASYGVTMALHNDLNNPKFKKKILPQFTKRLYKLMFKKGAPCSTTHILMRDYARYTIEIALLNNNQLLNNRLKKRIKPPFKDGGIRRWGKEKDRNEHEYSEGNRPFGTDFDNYTIGRLIHDRQNYDFENPEYVKAKSNMWWRIYQLGYSLEKFGEIDKEIAKYNSYRFGRTADGSKVDRYGKKYCWIAFYEVAGYRKDKGLLKDRWTTPEERISDTDLDPSFPETLQEIKIIKKDYLRGGPKDLAIWIQKGPSPDISEHLILTKINDIVGPWVLLDGYISQENYESKRGVFIFPRGFLINKKDAKKFNKYKGRIIVAGRALPEIVEDYYTFAGEIPWCDTFPYREYSAKIEIPTGRKINKKVPIDREVRPIFIKLGDEEIRVGSYSAEELKKGYSEFEEEVLVKLDVEIPVRRFSWESYHSVVNPGQSVHVLSKEISTELNLHIEPQSFDMLDEKAKKASITLQWGDPWHTTHELIFLRKDLLEKYLKKKNRDLVWVTWGEREYRSKDLKEAEVFAKKHKSYQVFQSIFSYSQIVRGS